MTTAECLSRGSCPIPAWLWYSAGMFQITRHAEGDRGAFVKLVRLETDDFAVVVRLTDGRLQHRYLGPDLSKAEEVFTAEEGKLPEQLNRGSQRAAE
jgi:hypothetical protein